MKKLSGRTAVITGAGSGIGRALSVALANRGCHLAISDINERGLEETAALVAEQGVRVSRHVTDVARLDQMEKLAEDVLSAHQGVNIMVNNAGVSVASSFLDHSLADFEWLMGINFWGVVYGSKLFLPHMLKEEEGHLVNISSVFGLAGVPLQSSYCASKFAVRGFTESLRVELKSTRVGVTSVHPGGIATNIAAASRVSGGAETQKLHQGAKKAFKNMLAPDEAARHIVRGIEGNKARVLITREAHVIDIAKRVAPAISTEMTAWGFERMKKRGR
jgi:short-subunit dehydrogenase